MRCFFVYKPAATSPPSIVAAFVTEAAYELAIKRAVILSVCPP